VTNVQKVSGVAALINAALSVATLVVALGLIGLPALTDRQILVELALRNPTPLILQDGLKFVSAALAIVLIAALSHRLKGNAPKVMAVATLFGSLSVICLVANAGLSVFSVSQAANEALRSSDTGNLLNGIISLLGFAVIFLNGGWYLLVSWTALKQNRLPKPLNYLGLGMGAISLLPPLGILVLFLSVIWSFGLGLVLLKSEGAG
jgi:hypothetical protein